MADGPSPSCWTSWGDSLEFLVVLISVTVMKCFHQNNFRETGFIIAQDSRLHSSRPQEVRQGGDPVRSGGKDTHVCYLAGLLHSYTV